MTDSPKLRIEQDGVTTQVSVGVVA